MCTRWSKAKPDEACLQTQKVPEVMTRVHLGCILSQQIPTGVERKLQIAPRPTKAPPTGRCPFGWVWDEQIPDEVLV